MTRCVLVGWPGGGLKEFKLRFLAFSEINWKECGNRNVAEIEHRQYKTPARDAVLTPRDFILTPRDVIKTLSDVTRSMRNEKIETGSGRLKYLLKC